MITWMRARESDDGFTLVELLVAIVIMVLVVGTLGFTLVGGLRSLRSAQDRVERSKDTALVGFVFPRDINSASSITPGGSRPCGTTGTPLLQMQTTNVRASANKTAQTVWYGVNPTGALMRYECSGSGIASTTSLADSVANPSVACEKQTTTSPFFAAVAGCAPASSVDRVALTLTLNSAPKGNTAVDSPQQLTLYGAMP